MWEKKLPQKCNCSVWQIITGENTYHLNPLFWTWIFEVGSQWFSITKHQTHEFGNEWISSELEYKRCFVSEVYSKRYHNLFNAIEWKFEQNDKKEPCGTPAVFIRFRSETILSVTDYFRFFEVIHKFEIDSFLQSFIEFVHSSKCFEIWYNYCSY